MNIDDPQDAADTALSVLYLAAVESFISFVRTLDADQWATPVACLPGWDVRDVLSHVSGIPDDAFAGRMDGAPGEAWTASQVKRNHDFTVDELLDRWGQQYAAFGDLLDGLNDPRPPLDCHAHEHDVRGTLGLAGNRESLVIAAGAARMGSGLLTDVPVTIRLDDGTVHESAGNGGGSAVSVSGLSAFELYRSRLGRRSRAQVEAYEWVGSDGDVADVIDAWFIFGPSEAPIIE